VTGPPDRDLGALRITGEDGAQRRGGASANLIDEVGAEHFRHDLVADHQTHVSLRDALQGLSGVSRDQEFEGLLREEPSDRSEDPGLVVHEEDDMLLRQTQGFLKAFILVAHGESSGGGRLE